MRTFIAEAVQVPSAARKLDSRSDHGHNRTASAFRCALLALLALGLLGGISQAQEPLVIGPSGDVSIAKTLSVTGDVSVAKTLSVGAAAFGDKISLWGKPGGANYGFGIGNLKLQIYTDTPGAAIAFGYRDSKAFTETMRIAGTGEVGIGTTTPNANTRLNVAGGIIAKTLSVTGNVGIGTEPTANKLSVGGNVNFSGNVGIGKPGPGKQLDVVGDVAVSGEVAIAKKLSVTLGNDNQEGLGSDKPGVEFRAVNGTQGIGFGFNTIYAAGTWGGQDLNLKPQTQGRVNVKGDLVVDKNLFVKGKLNFFWTDGKWRRVGDYSEVSGTYASSKIDSGPSGPSDLRLKRDLQPVPSALDKIRQLRGVTFRWNEQGLQYLTRDIETTLSAGPGASDEDNQRLWQAERDKQYKELSKTNVGVVAQDVEAVLPQAVTTDASGYKLVNYTELIPLVIEALKDEDKITQEQARTIASQQTEIQRLTVANQAAQQQLIELQEVKQKLGRLEASVNRFLASGISADADKTGTSELLAGVHSSEPQ
jgi:hypothetical protein